MAKRLVGVFATEGEPETNMFMEKFLAMVRRIAKIYCNKILNIRCYQEETDEEEDLSAEEDESLLDSNVAFSNHTNTTQQRIDDVVQKWKESATHIKKLHKQKYDID